jgi:hypothetical protein
MPKSLVRTKKSDPDILLKVRWTEQPYVKNGGESLGDPTTWYCKWCDLQFASQEGLRQHGVEAKACRGGQAG